MYILVINILDIVLVVRGRREGGGGGWAEGGEFIQNYLKILVFH